MDKRRSADPNDLPEDYVAGGKTEGKPQYIFSFHTSTTCDHPYLEVMQRGGNMYRCLRCNYAYFMMGGIQWPLHWTVIQAAQTMQYFARRFGVEAIGEVLSRPIGQPDKHPQVPVLPDGMSFFDLLKQDAALGPPEESAKLMQLVASEEESWKSNGKKPSLKRPRRVRSARRLRPALSE